MAKVENFWYWLKGWFSFQVYFNVPCPFITIGWIIIYWDNECKYINLFDKRIPVTFHFGYVWEG